VKLPNFLSVETRPFDPQTYEDEIDEEETLDEEGRARYLNQSCLLNGLFYTIMFQAQVESRKHNQVARLLC